jgi:ribosomal-protein-alanine N-acetyltransferase
MKLNYNSLVIRRMRIQDVDQIMQIEEASFIAPWSRKSFEAELCKTEGDSIVALIGDDVVGYLIQWIVEDEIHIANVAVHPAWRRRGIGEFLVRSSMQNRDDISWIGLEVRESNYPAIELYAKLGFKKVGVRRKYYAADGEDAVLMAKSIVSE